MHFQNLGKTQSAQAEKLHLVLFAPQYTVPCARAQDENGYILQAFRVPIAFPCPPLLASSDRRSAESIAVAA
jgi:hypothetical protein